MSLAKYSNRHTHRGKKLHWGRAEFDGLPFRGAASPMYRDEEFEDRLVRVGDAHAEVFDLSVPEQHEKYISVLDGCVNGWFQCLYRERKFDPSDPARAFMHVEWVEYFLEDGTPTQYLPPGITDLGQGAQMAAAAQVMSRQGG